MTSDDEEDDIEDEEYFPAPNITVTEDKSNFNVCKHILGIEQDGYENAFYPKPAHNNLKEKARVLSAKGSRKNNDKKTKAKPKPKAKETEEENDEDYIEKLLMGSFPEEKKTEKPKEKEEEVKMENEEEIKDEEDKKSDFSNAETDIKSEGHSEEAGEVTKPVEVKEEAKPKKKMMKLNKQNTLMKHNNIKGIKHVEK